MAELFGISTDVLIGYEWRSGDARAALERIESLLELGASGEAMRETEAALRRFPNSFELVHRCAGLYLQLGEEVRDPNADRRAIALLEHACELISQCGNEEVSELSLRILKKHNARGVNDALIGMVLGGYLHDPDGAERYLSRAFSSFAEEIDDIMVGYANVFLQRGDFDAAIDCLRWQHVALRGIQPEDELTRFDKCECVLLEIIAECHCFKGDFERARSALAEAVKRAGGYDHAGEGEIGDVKFYARLGIKRLCRFDLQGKTAMECLRRRVRSEGEVVPRLRALWEETAKEALKDEGT